MNNSGPSDHRVPTTIEGLFLISFQAHLTNCAELPARLRVSTSGRAAVVTAVRQPKAAAEVLFVAPKGRHMQVSNLVRKVFLGAAVALIPAASFAGVFVSVTIAPPVHAHIEGQGAGLLRFPRPAAAAYAEAGSRSPGPG